MHDDERCCGSGTCIIDPAGCCWCGQQWDGEKMVAAGALVTPGKRVKSRQLWAGSPAKFMRDLTDAEVAQMKVQTARYADLADAYRAMIAAHK
jgi:carbonic anhydrase/acetyltransferase-like protein (isoleucine patch superfamily)